MKVVYSEHFQAVKPEPIGRRMGAKECSEFSCPHSSAYKTRLDSFTLLSMAS